MKAGEITDLEVNREVRRVLVMHWIDLGRVSVHSQKGNVHVRGALQKLPGSDSPLTPATVEILYRKVKGAVGHRHLHVEFDNWTLNSGTGAWEHASVRDKRKQEENLGRSQSSYDLGGHQAEA
jgi:hypothetical protein